MDEESEKEDGWTKMEEEDWHRPMMGWGRGMAWRIALSIVLFFGLIIFIIIWLFFFAGGFNVYQNIAVIIVALLAFFGISAAVWATMWMRGGPRW